MNVYPDYVLNFEFPLFVFKKTLKEYQLGEDLVELEDYNGAIKKFEKCTEIDPKYVDAYYWWGYSLYSVEDYKGAIEKFEECTKIDPKYVDAYHYWGHALESINDYHGAIEKFKKCIEIDHDNIRTYYCWGNLLSDIKYYDDAIEKFKKCIEIDRDYIDAHNKIAYILYFQGKYKDAKEEWKKVRKIYEKEKQDAISEKDADFFSDFGELLCCRFYELNEAEDIYKEGLVLKPDHIDILIHLVHLYIGHLYEGDEHETKFYWLGREKYKKAESLLKDELSKDENTDSLYQLGDLYLEVGEYENAENFLLKTFEKDKDSADICIDLGILYLNKEDFKKAIKYFETALKIDPDSLEIKNLLAEAYLDEKLIGDAEKKYREIYDITHYNIDSLIGLGEVYANMGENSDDEDMYNEAIIYFGKVIDITQSEKEKVSKELNKKELAGVYYSRGYARVKLYEIETMKNQSILYDAKKDFENCFKNDPFNYTAKRSKEKIEKELGIFSSLMLIEKIGPWFIFGLSIFIFIGSQYKFFIDKSRPIDVGFYALLTFGSLIFIIAGISLPHILKLKFAGIEIEKSPIEITHRKILKIKKLRNH